MFKLPFSMFKAGIRIGGRRQARRLQSRLRHVRRFFLKAVKDLQAGKPPPGPVYDPARPDGGRIRCDVAYLLAAFSWRTLFE
jgi:hypothetical protein